MSSRYILLFSVVSNTENYVCQTEDFLANILPWWQNLMPEYSSNWTCKTVLTVQPYEPDWEAS